MCKEAGLSERYFYEAFDDGEALLIASLKATAGLVEGALDAAAEPSSSGAEGRLIAQFEGDYHD